MKSASAYDRRLLREYWKTYSRHQSYSRSRLISYLGMQRHREAFRIILELIRRDNSSCLILDLGAGDCAFSRLLTLVGRVVAVDVSEDDLLKARRFCTQQIAQGSLILLRADIRSLPFVDGIADMIVCTSVIEHLTMPELERFCQAVGRLLKSDGVMVVGFPVEGALQKFALRVLWAEKRWTTDPTLLGSDRYYAHPATHKTSYREIRQALARHFVCVNRTKLPAGGLPDILCFYEILALRREVVYPRVFPRAALS
jgi:SAM-dependent methyltransferase